MGFWENFLAPVGGNIIFAPFCQKEALNCWPRKGFFGPFFQFLTFIKARKVEI